MALISGKQVLQVREVFSEVFGGRASIRGLTARCRDLRIWPDELFADAEMAWCRDRVEQTFTLWESELNELPEAIGEQERAIARIFKERSTGKGMSSDDIARACLEESVFSEQELAGAAQWLAEECTRRALEIEDRKTELPYAIPSVTIDDEEQRVWVRLDLATREDCVGYAELLNQRAARSRRELTSIQEVVARGADRTPEGTSLLPVAVRLPAKALE